MDTLPRPISYMSKEDIVQTLKEMKQEDINGNKMENSFPFFSNILFGIFFSVKGSMALDTSDATTAKLKASILTQQAKKQQMKRLIQRIMWNLFTGLLLGRRIFLLGAPGGIWCRIRPCQWKGETQTHELVPQTGHMLKQFISISGNVNSYLWKEFVLLFPDYRPNVEESSRKWSWTQYRTGAHYVLSKDLPTY